MGRKHELSLDLDMAGGKTFAIVTSSRSSTRTTHDKTHSITEHLQRREIWSKMSGVKKTSLSLEAPYSFDYFTGMASPALTCNHCNVSVGRSPATSLRAARKGAFRHREISYQNDPRYPCHSQLPMQDTNSSGMKRGSIRNKKTYRL
jgi:hypothetical protein